MRRTTTEHGILRPHEAARHIDLRRYPPAPELERYVERFWAVHWDLDELYDVQLISHPCVNASFMPGVGAQLHGVGTTTSVHHLTGVGWVLGVNSARALSGADGKICGRDHGSLDSVA